MKIITALLALLACAACAVSRAENLRLDFDSPAALEQLGAPHNLTFSPDRKVAGAGAVAVGCMAENGHTFALPKDARQGVLSFWIFDPLFLGETTFRPGVAILCEKEQNGKAQWASFSLNLEGNNWQLHDSRKLPASGDEHGRDLRIPRHGGWTRIDVVAPAGAASRPFLLYIDGRPAGQTVEAYTRMTGVKPSAYWGGGTIYMDELSFNADPATFKPNVVRSLVLGDEAGRVRLLAGEPLKLGLALAREGATAPAGRIALRLLDGAEKEVASRRIEINWARQKEATLAAELPPPPHSGGYWVVATYTDSGTTAPVTTLERFDVQYYLEDQLAGPNDDIVLGKVWDWLPYGPNSPPGRNLDTPAQAPAAPPDDWSQALPIKGVWYSMGTMLREFGNQSAWYRRQLQLPADWKGRRIVIDIEDVQTLATVYIDRKPVGEVEWPGGSIDLTPFVTPGATLELVIFVRAEILAGYNRVLREILGDAFNPTENIAMRGLRGAVTLRAAPQGATIDHAAIRTQTSVTPKRLSVDITCLGLQPGRRYTLAGGVAAAGKPVLTLPEQTFVATDARAQVTLAAEWRDPLLWDIHTPFQYDFTARLSTDGKLVDLAAPVRFGFREIAFRERRVTLNGRPIHLFQNGVLDDFPNFGFATFMREMHLNSLMGGHYRHVTTLGSGSSSLRDCVAFCADSGVGVNIQLSSPHYTSQLVAFNKENDPRYWEFLEKTCASVLRKHGNNPGIFFWDGPGAGNVLGMGAMYNPYLQDGLWQRDYAENPQRQRLYRVESRTKALIQAADPTRPLVAQDSGNFTDASHITQYAGFAPMQELIEMNSYWREHGAKPLFYSEHGAPYELNWVNRPRGGEAHNKIIPYFAEWCAITRGDAAFVRTPLDNQILESFEKLSKNRYAEIAQIADLARREQARSDYNNGIYPPGHWGLYDQGGTNNARNQVWLERIREEYLNLRADGIGMLCPWTGGVRLRDYAQWLAPVLAYLSGAPGDRTDKTHIYAPGEELKRGVTLVSNDARPRRLRCEWKLTLGGAEVARHAESLELPPGGTRELPIRVVIAADKDCSGSLTLSLIDRESGAQLCDDQVAIAVLAPRPFTSAKRWALIDPEGDSAAALQRAGIPFQRVPFTLDLAPFDGVIFGRRAFLYELANTPEGVDLDALTQAGKKIVILEQNEATLRERFHFRTEYASPRIVYGRAFRGPLLDGLPDACLNFWRGAATLSEGYEIARAQLSPRPQEMNGGRWFYLWNDGKEHTRPMKWGNRHNLATVVVIKPDTGNFRTLVDCEFGLNYAAAWQLDHAAGQVIFSQLDVSGRTATGPEVGRYLQNLVTHATSLPAPSWRRAVYLGGDDGANFLASIFVPFTRLADPAAAVPQAQVLVLGEAAPADLQAWGAALSTFVAAGGVVFALPKSATELAAGWLPVPVAPTRLLTNGVVIGQSVDPLLAGLGNSDFFWRGNIELVSPGKLAGADLDLGGGVLTRLPQGRGSWLLCQIAPASFGSDEFFWLTDSRRNCERTLRTLLANLGVAMNAPHLVRRPRAATETLSVVDLAGMWTAASARGVSPQASPLESLQNWRNTEVPGDFRQALPELDGSSGALWRRRTFELEAAPPAGAGARLFLGAVRGIDFAWVNGVQVGHTDRDTNPNDLSSATRDYALPPGLLKQGRNEVALFCAYNTRASLSPGDGNLMPPLRVEIFRARQEGTMSAPVELDGWWRGIAVSNRVDLPSDQDPAWHRLKVPGNYMSQHGHWGTHMGYFWCKRSFTLTEAPAAGAQPTLLIGAVDDEDDTIVNGMLIGHTGKDTNPKDYYGAERAYRLPPGLLKAGENTVAVRVNNVFLDGGIVKSVRLLFEDPQVTAERKLALTPYLHDVGPADDPYVYCGW